MTRLALHRPDKQTRGAQRHQSFVQSVVNRANQLRGARSTPGPAEPKAERLKLPGWALLGSFLPLITRRLIMIPQHAGGPRKRRALQEARPVDTILEMYLHASKAKQVGKHSTQSVFANLAARPQRKHRDRRHPSWSCGAALRRAATNRASQPVWVDGDPPWHYLGTADTGWRGHYRRVKQKDKCTR